MDITINAKNHPNQEKLAEFYHQKLQDKFGIYSFITTIRVNIQKDKGQYIVNLMITPLKGNTMHAHESHISENIAFTGAVQKAKRQIEKYKESHYQSSHKNQTR